MNSMKYKIQLTVRKERKPSLYRKDWEIIGFPEEIHDFLSYFSIMMKHPFLYFNVLILGHQATESMAMKYNDRLQQNKYHLFNSILVRAQLV